VKDGDIQEPGNWQICLEAETTDLFKIRISAKDPGNYSISFVITVRSADATDCQKIMDSGEKPYQVMFD
jgi:hypothetical protein